MMKGRQDFPSYVFSLAPLLVFSHFTFWTKTDHEIFSTVILSLPLIQEGQLSVFWQKNVHNTG